MKSKSKRFEQWGRRRQVALVLALALGMSLPGHLLAAVAPDDLSPDARLRMRATTATSRSDSANVVKVVEGFHTALTRGDSAAVLDLLAPDVLILESGEIETLQEYHSHHLAADIAFARAVAGAHTLVGVRVEGNVAWVSSTSITRGNYQGRPVNSAGAELMVMTRQARGAMWKVRAIHWSSHRRSQ